MNPNISMIIESIIIVLSHAAAIYLYASAGSLKQRCFMLISYADFFCTACAVNEYLKTFIFEENAILAPVFLLLLLLIVHYLLLKHFKPAINSTAQTNDQEWRFLTLLMLLFLCMIISFFLYPNQISSFTKTQATTLLFIILTLLATLGAIFICLRNIVAADHAKQTALQLELLTVQIEAQRQTIAEAKRVRHDIRHHNLTLLNLAKKGGVKPLISYLECITEQTQAEPEISWCENDVLDSIFTVYSRKASEQHISCDILAEAEQHLPIQPPDLVAIVANLFENAIHGAADSKKESPSITIRIFHKAEKLVIRIDNDCKEELQYEDEMPAENYGIGLSNVLASIKHYDGELSLTARDGIFKAMVLLNLS